ncbi:MAG: radical SAM protein [Verrucomicrobia bacterium]|nr:radical SAM protein [Verrucomicrobiota bacterium]
MVARLLYRVWRTTDARVLWKFVWNFGVKGARSMFRFKRRLRRGVVFPPFLHLSIINSCNLRCQGCWVDVDAPREALGLDVLNRVIRDAKRHGNAFFGLLGGEPLLHPGLMTLLAAHPDCYFQVFTNGTLITERVAAQLRRLGNASPIISIEGSEVVSDQRRGRPEVYARTLRGLEHCIRARLLTGVATSVCQSNIDDLLTEGWLRELIRLGVHYVWFYTYRPVGPNPNYDLALRPDQHLQVRRFVVDMRARLPLAMIDAYYDGQGRSLCPMATGISHHVSPRGWIEPCPVIQVACENIHQSGSVFELMTQSAFLDDMRRTAAQAMRGCVVLERPDLIQAVARRHAATDSTARGTVLAEMAAMEPRFSQWLPGGEIPERHWAYRLVKRVFFSDFGAYRQARHDVAAKQQQWQQQCPPTPAPTAAAHLNTLQ